MAKKKNHKMPFMTFIALVLLSLAAVAVIDSFDTTGYVEADLLEVSGSTIILGNGCQAIVAETSPERAYSIELGIEGIIDERPNTHDIFAETLRSFNITLDYVTLDRYEDGVYYANLFLKTKDKVLKLDSKPSDAIALALRTNSTIYINETLLNDIGETVC
jgi:bifunctional DNase/RNase